MMEQSEFDRLQKTVSEPVTEVEVPTKLDKIKQQLSDAIKDGSLQIVDREEVALVAEFRIWKSGSECSTGIFHYKRKRRHQVEP